MYDCFLLILPFMEMYQSTKSSIGSKPGLWISCVIETGTGAEFL